MRENEDPAGKKLRLSRERQRRWRARQSQETLARLRRERHHMETTEQTRARLEANAKAHRLRRQRETPEQTQTRRAAAVARQHLAQERQSQGIRNEAINFVEAQVDAHNCGPMNIICQFCCSRNFVAERPSDGKFPSCCRKGKLKLPRPMDVNGVEQAYADFLRNLLTSSAQFREHIWRLLQSKMHDRSYAVMRLPVHLPNQQRIIFEEGNEEEALLAAPPATWQPNWQCDAYEGAQLNRLHTNVIMMQYKAAQTAIRDYFNPIMSAGKLSCAVSQLSNCH